MHRLTLSALAASGLLAFGAAAWAAPSPAPAQHLEIVADTTTYDGKAHTYQVEGHVKITLPQFVVTCQKATVYADAAETQVVKVVFVGDVEARRGTDSFKASRITYLAPERRLVAEGTTRARLKLPDRAAGPIQGP